MGNDDDFGFGFCGDDESEFDDEEKELPPRHISAQKSNLVDDEYGDLDDNFDDQLSPQKE